MIIEDNLASKDKQGFSEQSIPPQIVLVTLNMIIEDKLASVAFFYEQIACIHGGFERCFSSLFSFLIPHSMIPERGRALEA
jgi:hypothetical protein